MAESSLLEALAPEVLHLYLLWVLSAVVNREEIS